MKYLLLLLSVITTACIVEPMPAAESDVSIVGTWCNKDTICYEFTELSVYNANEKGSLGKGFAYKVHNEYNGGYYKEGVITSRMFETFGDVYFNVKRDVLIMYISGVLFKFDKVE